MLWYCSVTAVAHVFGQEMEEERNVRVESARIARGDVKDLATVCSTSTLHLPLLRSTMEELTDVQLSVEHYDALILPGGFGAAKNLCSFAFEGANCAVDEDVSTYVAGVRQFSLTPTALPCLSRSRLPCTSFLFHRSAGALLNANLTSQAQKD